MLPPAIAGFLLTAIPNWTGRLPVSGWPLAALALLWLAGRVAILFSAEIGGVAAAAIDVALPGGARRRRRARDRRRQELAQPARPDRARRADRSAMSSSTPRCCSRAPPITASASPSPPSILLISLIGGRIVPSFTSNWLARNNPGRLPVPFARFDMATIARRARWR